VTVSCFLCVSTQKEMRTFQRREVALREGWRAVVVAETRTVFFHRVNSFFYGATRVCGAGRRTQKTFRSFPFLQNKRSREKAKHPQWPFSLKSCVEQSRFLEGGGGRKPLSWSTYLAICFVSVADLFFCFHLQGKIQYAPLLAYCRSKGHSFFGI
jgi:hypothetical protein